MGNPGKRMGWVNKKERKLEFTECGESICDKFLLSGNTVIEIKKINSNIGNELSCWCSPAASKADVSVYTASFWVRFPGIPARNEYKVD